MGFDLGAQLLAGRVRLRDSGVGEADEELLSAVPRDHVGFATARPENIGNAPQDFVTGCVGVAVVDLLEEIDVCERNGELLRDSSAARELLL
jgi:hypothetical protein